MDGYITIGTKIDTKGATKDMEKLYQQIEREQDKIARLTERKQSLDLNIDKFKDKIEEAGTKTEELSKQLEDLAKTQLEIEGIPETTENLQKMKDKLSSFDIEPSGDRMSAGWYSTHLQAEQYQKIEQEFDRYVTKIEEANAQLDLTETKQSRISQEIQKATSNQMKLNQKLNEATSKKGLSVEDFEKGIGKIEKGFNRLVKKGFRLGLALVGVRTIINLITRSFNTLAQYNEELGTKVEQMRLVLAVALEPVINWIINLLHQVLTLINQIYSALSGISLFGRASELWSKKLAKNMASGASSAKEMKKQLAGFDEMNVLQDNQASGGGGGAGTDNKDWNLGETEIPEWMDWILKNGSLIAGIITGIAVAVLLLKLGLDLLLSLGIGILIAGIVMLIMDIIDYLKDPTWEKFGNIIRDIGVILIGLGIIIGNIPLIVIGAIVLIVGLVIKYWEQIKGFILGIADWFHQKGEDFKKNGNKFLGGIFELISKTIEDVVWLFEWLVNVAKTIFDGIIDFLKKVFAGDWEGAWESIKDTFGKIWDKIKEIGSKTWERLKENTKIFIDAVKDLFNKMVNWLAQKMADMYNKAVNLITSIINWIVNKFNIVINFFKGIGIAIGDFFSGAIKGAVNGVLSWVESKVNWFIDKINSVISLINKIPGVSIGRLSRISLPRLAVGGIINQPGRGVPVGGAIAGESGREGILPLTDRQAMAELGKEIGKWININATIPVNIGNRQVARVIQELNNDREFAMNS